MLLLRKPPLFAGLVVLGCAAQVPVQRNDWQHEQGVEALLQSADLEFRKLEDLRAEAKISYRQGQQHAKGTVGILFKAPAMLRVEVVAAFYGSVFTALVRSDTLHVSTEKGLFVEPVSSLTAGQEFGRGGKLLRELTGLDLGLFGLTSALFGLVDPLGAHSGFHVEYPRADLAIVTDPASMENDRRDRVRRRIWVDMHNGFVEQEEVIGHGAPPLVRVLKGYSEVAGAPGVYLPTKVDIRQGTSSLTLKFRDYQANVGLAAERLTAGFGD